jgi:hypothetical protein
MKKPPIDTIKTVDESNEDQRPFFGAGAWSRPSLA